MAVNIITFSDEFDKSVIADMVGKTLINENSINELIVASQDKTKPQSESEILRMSTEGFENNLIERSPEGIIISNEIQENKSYSLLDVAMVKTALLRENINRAFKTEITELD